MEECGTTGAIFARVVCIASYSVNQFDSSLNYALLGVTVMAFFDRLGSHALPLLAFYLFIQFALCLGLGCSGISIVWCACLGSSLVRPTGSFSIALTAALAVDAGAIAYYAITADIITTVAHTCALGMGMLCAYSADYLSSCHRLDRGDTLIALIDPTSSSSIATPPGAPAKKKRESKSNGESSFNKS